LSRYAPPDHPIRRGLPWLGLLLAAWALWVGVISEHSLWRIWRLDRERRESRAELRQVEAELQRLEREISDPAQRRRRAERWLREQGGMARPGEIVYRIQNVPADSMR
jgi:cell division protein FtsB